MKPKRTKATRNQKLAIAVGCLLFSNWWQVPAALAEEQQDEAVITEEVDVTDTRLQERQAIKKLEITSEDIKAQGAETAAQALEKAAGITVSGNNMQGKAAVSIRGSDANNTKVFVDGVPLSPVGDGVVDLSSIPADSIEKIEVFKGAVPVQYGSDAAGGVIYITTKKGGKKYATVSTAVGSWNTLRQNASLSGGNQQVDYFFNYKTETSDGYTWNTEKKAYFYDGKLGIQLTPGSSLSLFGSYAKKYEELPDRYDENGVLITNPGSGGTVGNPTNTSSFWYRTSRLRLDPASEWHGGLAYNQQLGDNSDLKLTLYKSAEDKSMTATRPPETVLYYGGQDSAASVHGYQLEHTIETSPVNTVLWGYNQEKRRFDQETTWGTYTTHLGYYQPLDHYYVPVEYWYDSRSYFLQDSLKLGKLTATLGYRHNVVEDYLSMDPNQDAINRAGYQPIHGNTTSHTFKDPAAGFSYALDDRSELHASIGKSFRYPQPAEIASSSTIGASLPRVKPEQTLNRDLGVTYSTPDGLQLDVTGFYKTVTDKIQSRTVVGQTTFENLPEVTIKGFEAGISKKISDQLKAFAQITYTSAENPKAGRQVNDQPEYKYSVGMNYIGNQGLKAYLALNYVGSRFSDFSNGSAGESNDPNLPPEFLSITLPAYTTVDFKLSKELKNREYYIKFINLFDKKYYSAAYLVAPGRYVEFGADIKF